MTQSNPLYIEIDRLKAQNKGLVDALYFIKAYTLTNEFIFRAEKTAISEECDMALAKYSEGK